MNEEEVGRPRVKEEAGRKRRDEPALGKIQREEGSSRRTFAAARDVAGDARD